MYFRFKILFLIALASSVVMALIFRTAPLENCNSLPRHGLWYWAGVNPVTGKIAASDNLYLHQGSVVRSKSNSDNLEFLKLGISPYKLPNHESTYLVYRLDKLGLVDQVIDAFSTDSYQWELRGNHIEGVQLDFDSPTHNLQGYIVFLKAFRNKLPQTFKLSVTGLADWPATGDTNDIQMIVKTADEIIFQLYSGKAPVKNLDLYMNKFSKLSIDFKLGVLESMGTDSKEFKLIKRNQHFKGFVYFLIN